MQYCIDIGRDIPVEFTTTRTTELIGIEKETDIEKGDTVTIEWEYDSNKDYRAITAITLVSKDTGSNGASSESVSYGSSTGEITLVYGNVILRSYQVDIGYGQIVHFREIAETEYVGIEDSSAIKEGDILQIDWKYTSGESSYTVLTITLVTEDDWEK